MMEFVILGLVLMFYMFNSGDISSIRYRTEDIERKNNQTIKDLERKINDMQYEHEKELRRLRQVINKKADKE